MMKQEVENTLNVVVKKILSEEVAFDLMNEKQEAFAKI